MNTELKTITALLALALPVSAAVAQGETINFQLGDVAATLHDEPCANEKIQQLLPPQAPQFRAAEVVWQGQSLAACWAVVESEIFVVDETGDSGFLSPAGFRNGEKSV